MIPSRIVLMVVASVICSSLAQISLKHGMAAPAMQQTLASGNWLQVALKIGTSMSIFGGLSIYALSVVMWLFVLARLDVSVAYPFVALGLLITMALGCALFGEVFSLRKAIGTGCVMLGVYLVSTVR